MVVGILSLTECTNRVSQYKNIIHSQGALIDIFLPSTLPYMS